MSDGRSRARAGGESVEGRVVGGIAEFGNDVATLAELQLKLAILDLKDCARRAVVPVILTVAGGVLALGAVPVVLFGVAGVLATLLHISTPWATLLVGAVVLAGAAALAAVSALRIGPSFSSFRRSQEELVRNINWIRMVLLYSGRSVPHRDH